MTRTAPALAVLALLAACGKPAEESDEPGTSPSPTPSEAASAAAPAEAAADGPPQAFGQCAVCHKVAPGENGIGPSLAGVYGAQAGHVGDFAYSAAMRQSGLTWDEATLDRYLEAPLKVVPGTKMSFAGLNDPAKRQAVIAYLKTL